MLSPNEQHLLKKVTTEYHGFVQKPEPSIYQNGLLFLSDGSGGLILNHLYIKTTSGLFDLSGAAAGTITAGTNVGGYNEVYKGVNGSLLEFRTIRAGSGITISQTANYLEITSTAASSGYETLFSNTATVVNQNVENTELRINTAGITSINLPNQTTVGFKKTLFLSSISLIGSFEINLTCTNGTKIIFDTVGQSAQLIWNSIGSWSLIGGGAILV